MITSHWLWPAAGLPERRLAGLALNPAAPEDVLLRLLDDGPKVARIALCEHRALPGAVVEAVAAHPDRFVRGRFARNPHVDPAQRARLVDDPEWSVRALLSDGPDLPPHAIPALLPDRVVLHMIRTYQDEMQSGFSRQVSAEFMWAAHSHPDPKVRLMGIGWRGVPDDVREALLADPDERVRKAVHDHLRREDPQYVERELPERPCHARTDMLLHGALSRKVVESVLTAPAAEDERATIARNPTLPADVVALLSTDPDVEVRERIAHHPRLSRERRRALGADPDAGVRESIAYRSDLEPDELRALTRDPDPRVRLAASMDLALTDTEREAIDYEVPMDEPFVPWPQLRVPGDPAEMRRNALSGHPMWRRKAARDRFLPPDLVERLATDDDLGVRVLLAQNHPEAPADLLLRSFLEYTGPQREQLVIRPDFPTAGLAHYADHEDPAVRALAGRDPATSAQTVERLTHDPDPRVRAAAARHANLPPARLAELLDDEELAHHAAANPALDPAVMRRLVASLAE
ncbi:hypothetical protein ACFWVC_35920 [Streptomyces sp. NPDC058691]|uniref:hypothetical protein n=1 Tax=Streptomyces sp. NPDC058691 TaxID=3346601 RepID=UPI003665850D